MELELAVGIFLVDCTYFIAGRTIPLELLLMPTGIGAASDFLCLLLMVYAKILFFASFSGPETALNVKFALSTLNISFPTFTSLTPVSL